MAKATKEYIVTLKKHEDLQEFYNDMESEGNNARMHVPSRSVECLLRRPISRNTNYSLTDEEAKLLRQDPRVESVTVKIKGMGQRTNMYATQTGVFDKSDAVTLGHKNWGLYRCQLESNASNWGTDGNSEVDTTISLTSTGKNVDVIIVDEILYPNHVEFGNRVNQYDWFQNHDEIVRGSGTTITNVSRSNDVATITTQTAHRLQGGEIIDIICTSDPSFSVAGVTVVNAPSTTTFRYANTGSNVTTTSGTGFWRGQYQYNSYTSGNNHATHIAGVIAGSTQGWAREANLYNLRSDSSGFNAGEYTPPEYLIDYIRQFHATKSINPQTGRKNPTLVNCSWGFGVNVAGQANGYTFGLRYSKLNYRNNFVSPSGAVKDTGLSGICSGSAKLADFDSISNNSGNRITTASGPSASVSNISFTEVGSSSLSDLGAPTVSSAGGVDTNDDATWQLSLPFPITYLGTTYQNNIYVNSNGIITFGGSNSSVIEPTFSFPGFNKILISAGDRNCETLYGGVSGSSPNRTYTVRYEGYDGAYGGAYEPSLNYVWEMTFYEATPAQIDVHIVTNANYRGEFTVEELKSYGFMQDTGLVPLRSTDVDADITDAINEGIIFVGAAGNNNYKIDVANGADYDNYYVDNGLPIYYHRGSTPGAGNPDVICVGEIGSFISESKSLTSNAGPRVDVYAPGTNVMSSVYDSTFTFGASVGLSQFTIDGGYAGTGSLLAQAGRAAIVTVEPHGLSNGDRVTIDDCSQSEYNVVNAVITVIDELSFSFDISNTGYSSALQTLTGTVKAYGIYQKASGTSIATAQVTGILALALETYPWMTQSEARNYILNYSKENIISETGSGYAANQSLQGGPNRFLYLHKERPSQGITLPKTRQWLRPSTGIAFPRQQIRKN